MSTRLRTRDATPNASAFIEGLRDVGYSLETALADIIDNSISAGANSVQILADTVSSEFKLAIVDDGEGMTEDELLEAMRPVSRNPIDVRRKNDLGRFGLGLKTASFSQCRKLTVVSRKNGLTCCARWDLDEVARSNKWLVQFFDDLTEIPWVHELKYSGTIVIWESLDRLIGNVASDIQASINSQIDQASEHLELVFHRFLAGESGTKKIKMFLNDRQLEGFDPFHSTHPATQVGPIEKIKVKDSILEIQTFTLPHHKKDPEGWERYGGRAGYLKNQGFYVYRAKRLIIHGTWFGLARQKELTKLTRVRIDMPNDMDSDWKIDIKKASAHPPFYVLERLRRIIDTIVGTSRRVYVARGQRLATNDRLPVWQRLQNSNEISYIINRDHPVLADFLQKIPSDYVKDFNNIIEMIASSIPTDALFADIGDNPRHVSGHTMTEEALSNIVEMTFFALVKSGFNSREAIEMMRLADPFRHQWELIAHLIERLQEQLAYE